MYDYNLCTRRDVICVDLKSFFASVSCIDKGLDPMKVKLAVVGDTKRQGSVVLAATPPLKKMGIRTGSRLFDIPHHNDIYITNPTMLRYLDVSNQITAIALQYAAPEDLHLYSVDEFFMDITDSYHLFADSPQNFCLNLRKEIYEKTKIFSTIGLGCNPLLAKLAMDFEAKSNDSGFAEWRYENAGYKMWSIQPLSKMWGINRRTEQKLNKKGIFTIGQLAHYPVEYLKRDFGIIGVDLHLHANGIDESMIRNKVVPKNKSLGKSQILMRDYKKNEVKVVLREQIDEVFYRARTLNMFPATVAIAVGYAVSGGIRKQFSEPGGFKSTTVIMNILWNYLNNELSEDELIRTIGISFNKLVSNDTRQLSLFDHPFDLKTEIIDSYLDRVRMKYGKDAVLKASSLTPSGTARERAKLVAGHKG